MQAGFSQPMRLITKCATNLTTTMQYPETSKLWTQHWVAEGRYGDSTPSGAKLVADPCGPTLSIMPSFIELGKKLFGPELLGLETWISLFVKVPLHSLKPAQQQFVVQDMELTGGRMGTQIGVGGGNPSFGDTGTVFQLSSRCISNLTLQHSATPEQSIHEVRVAQWKPKTRSKQPKGTRIQPHSPN